MPLFSTLYCYMELPTLLPGQTHSTNTGTVMLSERLRRESNSEPQRVLLSSLPQFPDLSPESAE